MFEKEKLKVCLQAAALQWMEELGYADAVFELALESSEFGSIIQRCQELLVNFPNARVMFAS